MRKARILVAVLVMMAVPHVPAQGSFPGANGRLAFATFSNVFSAAPNGEGLQRLSDSGTEKNRQPQWSADGEHIVFVCRGNAYSTSTRSELCMMEADGSVQTRLTRNDVSDNSPSWSPDGNWIAFTRTAHASGQQDVWIMRPDGTEEKNLTPDSFPDFYPRWSPDGDEILYMSSHGTDDPLDPIFPNENQDLFTVTPANGEIRNITNSEQHEGGGDWAPDGRRIAFTMYSEDDDAGWGLYVMRARGGEARQLTNGVFVMSPVWSPDGRWIAFSAITNVGRDGSLTGKARIMKIRPDGTGLTTVTRRPRHSYYSPSWQPL